jgi:anthranilate phosphoribosyltransferase
MKSLKDTLQHLFDHQTLSSEAAYDVLKDIGQGEYNPSEISAFLIVFQMRPITVEELGGFRQALLDLCLPVDLSEFDPIDLCGTGGDGKDTFNISTLASFVTAGAGVKVAKHGNYGVSSSCGSSNVMEHLGYRFTNDTDLLKRQIDQAGICFLHAPLFHPAMKHVAPIRRELGMKTFFNMLGPMVNPSRPKKQIVGVFSLELARRYQYLYQGLDKHFAIIHALDGYDEISLTGDFKLITNDGERLLSPEDIGFQTFSQEQLYGGETIAEAASLFTKIIEGHGTEAQNSAVLANAGVAIQCATGKPLDEAIELGRSSLLDGKAKHALETLIGL